MQKWFVNFKHMKIRNKLSILIAFIVAMTFAFALIVQQYAFSVYDEQLYLKSSRVLHLSSSAIEKELERIEQLSFNIITDTQIQSLLRSISDSVECDKQYSAASHLKWNFNPRTHVGCDACGSPTRLGEYISIHAPT
ncbi:hypothetical protein [Paenibacillus dokdonensis]|uniref:hypothetical protein n=1 Tax=Paenibacillus dokdonensis TaxID=2567944 RepID=UPI001FE5CB28|nr:hypothetical protein [Paenibacillus dokdonensis]